MMEFTAVCQYPGKDTFRFHSQSFWVESWSELEIMGRSAVAEEWAKISPHEPPPVVDFLPGALVMRRAATR